MPEFMTAVLTALTHILILIGMATLLYFIQFMIRDEPKVLERVLRTSAAMTGFLIYFGAKASGISVPQFMMASIATTNPFSFGLLSILIPSAAGILTAWYCLRSIRRSEDIATRTIILIVMFIVTMFADVYAATYGLIAGDQLHARSLLPNVTFTVALSLYILFKYDHREGRAGAAES